MDMAMIVHNSVNVVANIVVYDSDIVRLFAVVLTLVWGFTGVVGSWTIETFLMICGLSPIRHTKSALRFIRLPTIIFKTLLRSKMLLVLRKSIVFKFL